MRRLAAVTLLAVLIGVSGCLGGGLDEEALAANQTYEWETDTDVTFNVTGGNVYAVFVLENGTDVEVYRDTEFQGEQPISVRAVKFRYANGTIVNSSAIDVTQSGGRTILSPPDAEGKLAYSANSRPKDFQHGVNRSGSYEVILPPRMRIGVPFMGMISPGGAELTVQEGRTHLVWESLSSPTIDLHYYLERDFWLFAGILGVGLVGGVLAVLYFRLQIRRLRERIERSGLEVER